MKDPEVPKILCAKEGCNKKIHLLCCQELALKPLQAKGQMNEISPICWRNLRLLANQGTMIEATDDATCTNENIATACTSPTWQAIITSWQAMLPAYKT